MDKLLQVDYATDTIVARSTPEGVGALAVIRMSGPDAGSILGRVIRYQGGSPLSKPQQLVRSMVVDGAGHPLDEVLVVFFPGPRSYTGEDVAEVHCHGGEALVTEIIRAMLEAGARPAVQGEFTRRAFENGKIDLSRAEAVIRLISAGSRGQVVGATRALTGELAALVQGIKEELTVWLAKVEATIEFPEEPEVCGVIIENGNSLLQKVEELLAGVRRGVDHGMEVVIAGKQNVGKSSLVNAVAGRPVSIVTSEPGTTRDAVSTEVVFGGLRAVLVDTAGLATMPILGEADREAARVAASMIERAGLLVWVTDNYREGYPSQQQYKRPLVWVVNKSDLLSKEELRKITTTVEQEGGILVSALKGGGIGRLVREIESRIVDEYGPTEGIPVTVRQEVAIRKILQGVTGASKTLANGQPELAAIDIRDSLRGTGDLLGEGVDVDVLDRIFGEFCIGK